jgi:hypothetical protein
MSLWSYKKAPPYFNKIAATPVVSTAGWKVATAAAGTRFGEVLVAIKGLTTKNAVAYPTFTITQTTTKHYVTGETITLVVTASSAVAVSGLPTIDLVIPSGTKQAVFDPTTSTSTVLNFKYTFVAGDIAGSQITIANTVVPQAGYSVTMPIDAVSSEKIPDANLTYTAITNSGVTVN